MERATAGLRRCLCEGIHKSVRAESAWRSAHVWRIVAPRGRQTFWRRKPGTDHNCCIRQEPRKGSTRRNPLPRHRRLPDTRRKAGAIGELCGGPRHDSLAADHTRPIRRLDQPARSPLSSSIHCAWETRRIETVKNGVSALFSNGLAYQTAMLGATTQAEVAIGARERSPKRRISMVNAEVERYATRPFSTLRA